MMQEKTKEKQKKKKKDSFVVRVLRRLRFSSKKESIASVSKDKKQPAMPANSKRDQVSSSISLENKKTSEKEAKQSKEPVIEQSNTEKKRTSTTEVANEQSETATRPTPVPAKRTTFDQPSLEAARKRVEKPPVMPRKQLVPSKRDQSHLDTSPQKPLQTITSKSSQQAKKAGPTPPPKPKKTSHETHQR